MAKYNKFEDIRLKVKNWALEGKCAIREIQNPGDAWVLNIAPDASYGVAVSMKLDTPDLISFGTTLQLNEYSSSIGSMTHKERKSLVLGIRLYLASFERFGFDVPDDLSYVNINYFLFLDELTKARFWTALYGIDKMLSASTWMIDKKLLSANE
ncbi:MAG: DUF2299 family protein [Acidobacteria bacterium]|nr:DUF2299 family protein [Acidobacteriota bacterium]